MKTDFPTLELPMTAKVKVGISSPSVGYDNVSNVNAIIMRVSYLCICLDRECAAPL